MRLIRQQLMPKSLWSASIRYPQIKKSNIPNGASFKWRKYTTSAHYGSSTPTRSGAQQEQQQRLTQVYVTGGSRGIGHSIARSFASYPQYALTLLGRSLQTLKPVWQELHALRSELNIQLPNGGIRIIEADISDPRIWSKKELPAFAGESESAPMFGQDGCDVWVNAAGVSHSSLLSAMSTSSGGSGEDRKGEVEKIVDTNLMGTIYACKGVSRAMLRNVRRNPSPHHTPCIINIASLLGVQGGRGSSVYAASKAGVLGLTRALAAELGLQGIRVNAIVPGYIDTAMTEAMDPKAKSNALAKIPLKRFGAPEEIAEAALFLVRNEYANNCVLNLDGGLSAAM